MNGDGDGDSEPAGTGNSTGDPGTGGAMSENEGSGGTPAEGTGGADNGGANGAGGSNGSGGMDGSGGNGGGGYVPPNGNPIEVPADLLTPLTEDSAARCIEVDLHTVPVPPNPGYQDEMQPGGTFISGDDLWATAFYMMLYSNCERQARGLEPFKMYSDEKQVAMQATYIGQDRHTNFGERAMIAGGGAAEGAGGAPLIGVPIVDFALSEDDDGNGLWSPSESARRTASGNQQNGSVGLVDHGDAMIDPGKSCVFAAVTLGPDENERIGTVLFYGTNC